MSIKFVLKRKLSSSPTTNRPTVAEYPFEGDVLTIGSDSANHLVLEGAAFEQAVVVREGERLTLINSADGTKLNGAPLRREALQPLAAGDEIEIGDYLIAVENATESADENQSPNDYSIAGDEAASQHAVADYNVSAVAGIENQVVLNTPPLPPAIIEERAENGSPTALPARNFADILDTLRTEDDKFYLSVKTNDAEIKRIALDQAETRLGAAASGEIVADGENIALACAVARKDWSGITLEAASPNAATVNGEKLDAARRLRHDDEIVFTHAPKFRLTLHEPSSLVALESLLAARTNGELRLGGANGLAGASGESPAVATAAMPESFLERRYFKHFSFFEFAAMIIGTLIGAVLIFLLLELMFS